MLEGAGQLKEEKKRKENVYHVLYKCYKVIGTFGSFSTKFLQLEEFSRTKQVLTCKTKRVIHF